MRDNCFSITFKFLLSMWLIIFRSISCHYSGMKFKIFLRKQACMLSFNPSIPLPPPSLTHFIYRSGVPEEHNIWSSDLFARFKFIEKL